MTEYLEPIRGFMDDAIADNLDYDVIHRNLLAHCNARWDEYWYAGVIWLADARTDGLVVGYAFRNHWYWHNNYGPNMQTFIFWKDYNCGPRDGAGGMGGPTEHVSGTAPSEVDGGYNNQVQEWI